MAKNFGVKRLLIVLAILAVAPGEAQVVSSTNAALAGLTTNAPSATAPAAVPLANVVGAESEDSAKLQEIQSGIFNDQTTAQVDRDTSALVMEIDQRQQENDEIFAGNPTLTTLRSAQAEWQTLADSLASSNQTLTGRIAELDATGTQLDQMTKKWQATLSSAKAAGAPSDILRQINGIIGNIDQTSKAVAALKGRILSAQFRVAAQDSRVASGLATIKKAQDRALSNLFVRDSPPIWGIAGTPANPSSSANSASFAAQIPALRTYVAQKFSTLLIHLIIFDGLALALFFVRREVEARSQADLAVRHAAEVFKVPLATAGLLTLLISHQLYPLAPSLFWAVLLAAALLPAVLILRRLIEPALFPILYAMVISYVLDQLRHVIADQPILSRVLFLIEVVAAGLFLAWLLHSRRLSGMGQNLLDRAIRVYARFALVIFSAAILANCLGYSGLSYQVGNAMLWSSYLALILYAAVRIADGIIFVALKIRPLSLLGMVQGHRDLLAANASRGLRWVAFFFWLWIVLESFSVRTPLVKGIWSVLDYTIPYGSIPLSLGPLVLFGLTIWAALLISRFIRFVLEEEVYPHLALGPGVPYAISTITHYVVLVTGILFALEAVNIHLRDYSVLAGALGVGLGFGLQNIMNNFVSGLILLFERPIKVGDVIQVDTAVGTVERIGIRASVIRITNGSEVIMPNGNLISNQVTNWTFSDRQRAIDIPVAVAAKADPQRVMALLIEAAKAHPKILPEPPPQVLFSSFSAATFNFELRAWTNSEESWAQVRSDLSLAISVALARENIPMS
jgi:small-conductance mechanosensitive channel